jgi:predicted RNA-binding protein YlqC (UPF0109 family)
VLQLVRYLAESLGARPDFIQVTEKPADNGETELTLYVHQDDMNSIIGKHGRTIRAMRAIMAISSAKSGKRAFLRIDASLDTKSP